MGSSNNDSLETGKADRLVWLLKCPTVVSQAWQQSHANNASDTSRPLAKVYLSVDPLRYDPLRPRDNPDSRQVFLYISLFVSRNPNSTTDSALRVQWEEGLCMQGNRMVKEWLERGVQKTQRGNWNEEIGIVVVYRLEVEGGFKLSVQILMDVSFRNLFKRSECGVGFIDWGSLYLGRSLLLGCFFPLFCMM